MNRLLIALLTGYAVVFAVLEVLYLPVYIGTVAVPFGALGAALTNAMLVHAAGWFTTRTSAAALPVIGWLVAVLVLSSGGPGGDVLVPNDWRALLLFGLGLLPAAVVLGRHLGGASARRAVSGS
ncbi:MAG: hypothetical protein ACXVXP_11265 [Mycobacteriaceae bacterium]